MSGLVEWLTSILDEDEKAANSLAMVGRPLEGGWGSWFQNGDSIGDRSGYVVAYGVHQDAARRHITLHDPAAVLADIAAKRAVITLLWAAEDMAKHTTGVTAVDAMHEGRLDVATAVVRRLASAYADRPGYDESWRP